MLELLRNCKNGCQCFKFVDLRVFVQSTLCNGFNMYLYVFVFVLETQAVVASLPLPTSVLHYQTLTLLVFYHWPSQSCLFFSCFTLHHWPLHSYLFSSSLFIFWKLKPIWQPRFSDQQKKSPKQYQKVNLQWISSIVIVFCTSSPTWCQYMIFFFWILLHPNITW